jgi:hypothetical protein
LSGCVPRDRPGRLIGIKLPLATKSPR